MIWAAVGAVTKLYILIFTTRDTQDQRIRSCGMCVMCSAVRLTALSIVCDAQHQAQQTLGVLPLLQQHLCIAGQAQEQAEGRQRVGRDGGHGLHRGGWWRGRLRLLLVDGWRLGGDGFWCLVHQLARLLDSYPLKLVAVLGLLLCGRGHHRGADLWTAIRENRG